MLTELLRKHYIIIGIIDYIAVSRGIQVLSSHDSLFVSSQYFDGSQIINAKKINSVYINVFIYLIIFIFIYYIKFGYRIIL